jgi:hypothetical protein
MNKALMMSLLTLSTCHMAPSLADNTVSWGPLSYIQVEEVEGSPEGCVAKVWFKNYNVHGFDDTNRWTLDMYDTQVEVHLEVDVYGPDTLHVEAPEGYFAYPESLVVPEDVTDHICIYEDGVVVG